MDKELFKDTKLNDSKTNGLITKIWGPHFWETLHFVSFGYPLEPTAENKKQYKDFFVSVANVLPCRYCRESYTGFLNNPEEKETHLTDKDLENRESLSKWVYRLHERVNKKLGLTYGIKYDDICVKYESCRAVCVPKAKSCNMPLYLKANSYTRADIVQAPIISEQMYNKFKSYAKERGVIFSDSIKLLLKEDRLSDNWILRDKYCVNLIKKMRKNGLASIELDGKYKGLPTVEELKLMKFLSTTLCCEELEQMLRN